MFFDVIVCSNFSGDGLGGIFVFNIQIYSMLCLLVFLGVVVVASYIFFCFQYNMALMAKLFHNPF